MTKYFDSANPKNWTQVTLLDNVGMMFAPRNGALIDLEGLEATAQTENRILFSYLRSRFPFVDQVVLYGLELNGKSMTKGPPGIVKVKKDDILSLSAGAALLCGSKGERYIVNVEEKIPIFDNVENSQGKFLALMLDIDNEGIDGSSIAYSICSHKIAFLSSAELQNSHCLPLAKGMGGEFWFTDIARVWRPDHDGILLLGDYMDKLEQVIWDSDRHGDAFFKYKLLGADWKLYQAKASSAVTAARLTLFGRSSSTEERIRVLKNLYWQLLRSVEAGAQTLKSLLGKEESDRIDIGSYTNVFEDIPESW